MAIGILGGSFNPVHIGHLRLMVEVREALGSELELLELLPCALPPHKPARAMLPFALRCELLEAAVQDIPGVRVSRLEGLRAGPSYTWETLRAYRRRPLAAPPYFILGGGEFSALPQWHRGLELPGLAHLLVAARLDSGYSRFREDVARFWPGAQPVAVPWAQGAGVELPEGGRVFFLPLPRLDISASLLRRRFVEGRDLRWLVPERVRVLMEARREELLRCWG